MFDVDALAELWALTILSLYVRSRTPTAGDIHFKRGAFPALKYFRYMCGGVIFLTFDKESMPKLWKLNIGFNTHRGGTYGNILAGIQHLLNLQEICVRIGASFGAEESDRRAAESAFHEAIAKYPCLPKFTVKRCDQVDGEYDHLEKNYWVQEVELSSERSEFIKEQHGARTEGLLSNDPPGVLEKMTGDDIQNHVSTRYGVLFFLLILQKLIFTPNFLDIYVLYSKSSLTTTLNIIITYFRAKKKSIFDHPRVACPNLLCPRNF
jgi:hypothetical protein